MSKLTVGLVAATVLACAGLAVAGGNDNSGSTKPVFRGCKDNLNSANSCNGGSTKPVYKASKEATRSANSCNGGSTKP